MEVPKVPTPEYLSNDIIEEDFLQSFLVLYRLQYITGSCRLDIKNRFATAPTAYQKCYTILCIISIAAINIVLKALYTSTEDPIIDYLTVFNLILLFMTFFFNIIHVRFFNSNKNEEFFVKLQQLDRVFKIDRWKVMNKWVKTFTNVPVAMILLACGVLMILICHERGLVCLCFFGPAFSILTFLLELTACSSIIAFFVIRIKFINSLMENHLTQDKIIKPFGCFRFGAYIRYYTQELKHYYEASDTNIYLRELFKCFKMYQDLYKFQLFIFCVQSVASSLLSFELVLYLLMQNNESSLTDISAFIVFTIVNLSLAIFLGFRYELFFHEVRETKRLCINIMAKYYEGPLWEKARTMLKMIDETPPRFSVYEMWDMNASTFVTMFSLITSLIVTLLQFALL